MSKKPLANAFSHYLPARAEEIDALWQSATIVLDTSAIGYLYRVVESAREAFLSNLEEFSDRVWMPHQVGVEYHRNFESFKSSSTAEFEQASGALKAQKKAIEDRAKAIAALDHEFNVQDRLDAISSELDALIDAIDASRDRKSSLVHNVVDEEIYSRLNKIFEGKKIGHPFSPKALMRHRAAAAQRFQLQIPPGYGDAGKGGDRQFGDYFLWAQLLESFRNDPRDVIFVTNDQKPDWFDSKRKAFRPELHEEFATVTGRRIYFQTSTQFVKGSSRFLQKDAEEAEKAATEFENTSDADALERLNQIKGLISPSLFANLNPPQSTIAGLSAGLAIQRGAADLYSNLGVIQGLADFTGYNSKMAEYLATQDFGIGSAMTRIMTDEKLTQNYSRLVGLIDPSVYGSLIADLGIVSGVVAAVGDVDYPLADYSDPEDPEDSEDPEDPEGDPELADADPSDEDSPEDERSREAGDKHD